MRIKMAWGRAALALAGALFGLRCRGGELVFHEDFEDEGFTNRWDSSPGQGTPGRRQGGAWEGDYSYVIDQQKDVIYHVFEPPLSNVIVTVRFYDSMKTGKNAVASATAAETAQVYGDGLGVYQRDNNFYVCKPWDLSGVARSNAWHEFKWDYSSGTNFIAYIDGKPVRTNNAASALQQIWIGASWGQGQNSGYLFDDVRVESTVASPALPRGTVVTIIP